MSIDGPGTSISAALISDGNVIYRDAALKRAALLFDHLLVFDYALHTDEQGANLLMPYQRYHRTKFGAAQLAALWKFGVVHDLYGYGSSFGQDAGDAFSAKLVSPVITELFSGDILPSDTLPFEQREEMLRTKARDLVLREAASLLRSEFDIEATLIDRGGPTAKSLEAAGTDVVLGVVLEDNSVSPPPCAKNVGPAG